MDGDQIARLIYLSVLVIAIGGWFFTQNRQKLSKNVQFAAVWVLIFVGAIAVVGLWEDIQRDLGARQSQHADGAIEIPRSADGHFRAVLLINGTPTTFTVDTGATNIVLSQRDAIAAGIDTDRLAFLGEASTANGIVRTARVTLDTVSLEQLTDRGVTAWVNGGELDDSLLGMDYLNRFTRIAFSGGRLILER